MIYTKQQVMDIEFMFRANHPRCTVGPKCAYVGKNNNRCAIALLLPEKVLDRIVLSGNNSASLAWILKIGYVSKALKIKDVVNREDFLLSVQRLHDSGYSSTFDFNDTIDTIPVNEYIETIEEKYNIKIPRSRPEVDKLTVPEELMEHYQSKIDNYVEIED